jgi:hypothetical protein
MDTRLECCKIIGAGIATIASSAQGLASRVVFGSISICIKESNVKAELSIRHFGFCFNRSSRLAWPNDGIPTTFDNCSGVSYQTVSRCGLKIYTRWRANIRALSRIRPINLSYLWNFGIYACMLRHTN